MPDDDRERGEVDHARRHGDRPREDEELDQHGGARRAPAPTFPETTAHAADAVRDARLALRSMGLKLKEADALIGVALSQLPANATADEIAAAAFRAMH